MTLTAWQIAAIMTAADAGGLYLDGVGKSDLAKLDESEWMTFVETVCAAYHEEWDRQRDSGEPPF